MKKTCINCANWENRPEGGMDANIGYCRAQDKITGKGYACDLFLEKNGLTMEEAMVEGYDDEFGDDFDT